MPKIEITSQGPSGTTRVLVDGKPLLGVRAWLVGQEVGGLPLVRLDIIARSLVVDVQTDSETVERVMVEAPFTHPRSAARELSEMSVGSKALLTGSDVEFDPKDGWRLFDQEIDGSARMWQSLSNGEYAVTRTDGARHLFRGRTTDLEIACRWMRELREVGSGQS